MKKLLLALSLLLCIGTTRAATIALNDTPCGSGITAICSNPAPGITSLSYSSSFRRLVVVIDGMTYDSGLYQATPQGGSVYAADGSSRVVETVFATWTTYVRSGRSTAAVQHWELKAGSVQ